MSTAHASRMLIVGADGADWRVAHRLMDDGRMPNLTRLVETGVIADIRSLDPSVCVMHWASILTGHRAAEHGICSPVEVDEERGRPRLVSRHRLRVPGLATILGRHDIRSVFAGWPFSYPAEQLDGVVVTDLFTRPVAPVTASWPILAGQVSPHAAAHSLTPCRVHPGELDYDDLVQFFPGSPPLDGDPRVAEIARIVAETASVHGVVTELMAREDWQVCAVLYDLLNAVSRSFIAYHPPRPSHVDPHDYEIYNQVVDVAYEFFDALLGRLIQIAGNDAHVLIVSDHGYHSGSLRPRDGNSGGVDQTARWHRPGGLLCLRGPGIKPDERIHGAGPLDVLPTVLTLLGLPVHSTLPGKPLRAVFTEPPTQRAVPPGIRPHPDPDIDGSTPVPDHPGAGYLELRNVNVDELNQDVRDAEHYNLARAFLGADRPAEAVPLLDGLVAKHPGELRFQLFLAEACFACGELERSARLAEEILGRVRTHSRASLILARVRLSTGDVPGAMSALREAETLRPDRTRHHLDVAEVYLQVEAWSDAERCIRRALDVDEEDADAWTLLCRCCTGDDRLGDAIEAGEVAVGLDYDSPSAHLHLGIARMLAGDVGVAVANLRTCLSLAPGTSLAHAVLARHYEATGDDARAAYHGAQVKRS